jgi:hypothetical protein
MLRDQRRKSLTVVYAVVLGMLAWQGIALATCSDADPQCSGTKLFEPCSIKIYRSEGACCSSGCCEWYCTWYDCYTDPDRFGCTGTVTKISGHGPNANATCQSNGHCW